MFEFPKLTLICEDVVNIPNEEFAMIRKNGLGASDASVYLNLLGKFRSPQDLIDEKCRFYMNDEDKAIGEKETVRKGKDLESLVLQKAQQKLGIEVIKPVGMYRVNEFPYLTISFDGVAEENGVLVPVEAKFCSTFGDKYYNRDANEGDYVNWHKDLPTEKKAALLGIPAYYYAQVQQQMLGLDAPYGYVAVIHDKGWFFRLYKIPRDDRLIMDIVLEGSKTWDKIIARRTAEKALSYTEASSL